MLLPNGGVTLFVENLTAKVIRVGNQILDKRKSTYVHFSLLEDLRYVLKLTEQRDVNYKGTIPQEILDLLNQAGDIIPIPPTPLPPNDGGQNPSYVYRTEFAAYQAAANASLGSKASQAALDTISQAVAANTSKLNSVTLNKGIEVLTANPTGADLYEGRMWIIKAPVVAPVVNTPPSTPTIAVDSTGSSSIGVRLTTSSTDAQDGAIGVYEVYVNGVLKTTTSLIQGGTYLINGLASGTAYSIVLKATDTGGLTTSSNTLSVTTAVPTTTFTAFTDTFTAADGTYDNVNYNKLSLNPQAQTYNNILANKYRLRVQGDGTLRNSEALERKDLIDFSAKRTMEVIIGGTNNNTSATFTLQVAKNAATSASAIANADTSKNAFRVASIGGNIHLQGYKAGVWNAALITVTAYTIVVGDSLKLTFDASTKTIEFFLNGVSKGSSAVDWTGTTGYLSMAADTTSASATAGYTDIETLTLS